LTLEQLFANVEPMVEASAGVLLEATDDEGQLHRHVYRPRLRGRVYVTPDHYLAVQVMDTGEWVLHEVNHGNRPRVIARGKLPSSRYAEDRRWDPRR
jgi:hypothetical protein